MASFLNRSILCIRDCWINIRCACGDPAPCVDSMGTTEPWPVRYFTSLIIRMRFSVGTFSSALKYFSTNFPISSCCKVFSSRDSADKTAGNVSRNVISGADCVDSLANQRCRNKVFVHVTIHTTEQNSLVLWLLVINNPNRIWMSLSIY